MERKGTFTILIIGEEIINYHEFIQKLKEKGVFVEEVHSSLELLWKLPALPETQTNTSGSVSHSMSTGTKHDVMVDEKAR